MVTPESAAFYDLNGNPMPKNAITNTQVIVVAQVAPQTMTYPYQNIENTIQQDNNNLIIKNKHQIQSDSDRNVNSEKNNDKI